MKIRRDFVTNSSSSSFVVSFDKIPTDYHELKTMLFGDDEYFNTYNETIPTITLSEVIFNDMKSRGKVDVDLLIRELMNGYVYDAHDAPDYMDYKSYDDYRFASMVYFTDFINAHFSDLSNVFILEYGNEVDGPFADILEDDRIFKRVRCIKIDKS